MTPRRKRQVDVPVVSLLFTVSFASGMAALVPFTGRAAEAPAAGAVELCEHLCPFLLLYWEL